MKKLLIALLLGVTVPSHAQYFQTYFQNLAHPQMNAGVDYTMKGSYDGAVTKVALVYHSANPNDSIIPKSWQNVIPPDSWCLLCAGISGNAGNYDLKFGPSVNLEPQVLGWAIPLLKQANNPTATVVANLLGATPNGGLAFGIDWSAAGVQNGHVQPFDKWGYKPDLYTGILYKF